MRGIYLKKLFVLLGLATAFGVKAQTTNLISVSKDTLFTANLIISQNTIIEGNGFRLGFAPNNYCKVSNGATLLIKNSIEDKTFGRQSIYLNGCGAYEHYNAHGSRKGTSILSGVECIYMGSKTHYLYGTLK